MTPPSLPPGLYGLADAAFGDPVHLGEQLAQGGAAVIQLRAKKWSTVERARACRALVERLAPASVLVIMNDDLEAAYRGGAHGLHLGQTDGSLADARVQLGPTALLGRSTHSIDQVARVEPAANYIGFGPVFETTTKAAAGSARGLQLLEEAVLRSRIPVVAIGGIRLGSMPAIRRTGASHWAVASDILTHQQIARRARQFVTGAP